MYYQPEDAGPCAETDSSYYLFAATELSVSRAEFATLPLLTAILRKGPPMPDAYEGQALRELHLAYEAAPKEYTSCPVCEGEDHANFSAGDRHDLGLSLSLCRRCASCFLNPRPPQSWFNDMYRDLYWPVYIGSRFTDYDDMWERDRGAERASDILDVVVPELIPTPEHYLDIGTGLGGMLHEFRSRFPHAHISGIEPSQAGVDFCARRHGIEVHQYQLQEMFDDDLPGPYDFITMIHVLEHTLNPVRALQQVAHRLDSAGWLYVEVPDANSPHWHGKEFVHIAHYLYLTEQSLNRILQRVGLEPVRVFHGAARSWQWAIGILAKPRSDGPLSIEQMSAASAVEVRRLKRHLVQQIKGKRQGGASIAAKVKRFAWCVLNR